MRESLGRWQAQGMGGLMRQDWERNDAGNQGTWNTSKRAYEKLPTDNSQQLAQKLAKERTVRLSADPLRQVLKKGE